MYSKLSAQKLRLKGFKLNEPLEIIDRSIKQTPSRGCHCKISRVLTTNIDQKHVPNNVLWRYRWRLRWARSSWSFNLSRALVTSSRTWLQRIWYCQSYAVWRDCQSKRVGWCRLGCKSAWQWHCFTPSLGCNKQPTRHYRVSSWKWSCCWCRWRWIECHTVALVSCDWHIVKL